MANDLQTVSNGIPFYGDGTPGYGRQDMVYSPAYATDRAQKYQQIPVDQRRYVGDPKNPDLAGFVPAQSTLIPGQGTIYPYEDPYGYPTSTVFTKPDEDPGLLARFMSWITNGFYEPDRYWYDPRFMTEPYKGSKWDFMRDRGYIYNDRITRNDYLPMN